MFKTSEQCSLELVAHSTTDDLMPARAARVSFGKEDLTGKDISRDIKLINYLAAHRHLTPFEYHTATFLIECPLFIRSQIHRHRTFSYNEISRRYTDENLEFWVPSTVRSQAISNRQASAGVVDDQEDSQERFIEVAKICRSEYRRHIASGVCREQARAVLPQSLLTKFYMGGNLRNWAHFVELRRDEHAQPEVQIVANRIAGKLRELWPESCKALGI